MIGLSTGLKNALLDALPLRQALSPFLVDLFAGTRPDSADSAPGTAPLATFALNHDGLSGGSWDASAAAGVLQQTAGETLQAIGLAAGTATWFRIRLAADPGTTNTTDRRIDGDVAATGGDLAMVDQAIVVDELRTLALAQIRVL